MASIKNSKILLAFTSPRTIEKIIPEINLLQEEFSGKKWERNSALHEEFFRKLYESDFYEGKSYPLDPVFAGRDRITRVPKAYGFIDLEPIIQLTPAGKSLIKTKRPEEVFLRQLLKFQLPSPYHTNNHSFNVKPYLELLRLVYEVGSISKHEVALFFLQLTHYKKFDFIKDKIYKFREQAKKCKISNRSYIDQCLTEEIKNIFSEEITSKKFKTRESGNNSNYENFIKKKGTLKDYANAYIRHIRSTGTISFDPKTLKLVINPAKTKDVIFILETISREVNKFKDIKHFKQYLFSDKNITLFSDNRENLLSRLKDLGQNSVSSNCTIGELKSKIYNLEKELIKKKTSSISKQLKSYQLFDDIMKIFEKIKLRDVPDAPLFLEWNVWRALVMINYADRVDGNFIVDTEGTPLNTAGGNKPDVEAEYPNFGLIAEVTMSSGNTQYNMEGEPVPRHFGKFKQEINKETYCLFIAPKISKGTLAHYFNLNKMNTRLYGGKTKIIPLNMDQFINFIKEAKNNNFDNSSKLQNWMEKILKFNQICKDEEDWSSYIFNSIKNWAA